MKTLEPEVESKLDLTWPSASDRTTARDVLRVYGSASGEIEVERVRLALIKLSNASLDELRTLTATAKSDYRDVLMWAEYPEASRSTLAFRSDLSASERRELSAIRARDRAQYEAWRKQRLPPPKRRRKTT